MRILIYFYLNLIGVRESVSVDDLIFKTLDIVADDEELHFSDD